MTRIFIGLASLNGLALLATFAIGFFCEGRAQVQIDTPLTAPHQAFAYHFVGGLFTVLLTLLVQSIILTYFVGTGRWIQEVVAAYRLPVALWERARSLKSGALPFVLGSIFLVIGATMLGAASDRGLTDSVFHLMVATAALAFNFWGYMTEYRAVQANGDLIEQIRAEVERIRGEQGLRDAGE